jgi:hypothetical protein
MAASKFPLNQIVRILMLVTALVAVLLMRNACASGVTNWFNIVAPTPRSDAGGTTRTPPSSDKP